MKGRAQAVANGLGHGCKRDEATEASPSRPETEGKADIPLAESEPGSRESRVNAKERRHVKGQEAGSVEVSDHEGSEDAKQLRDQDDGKAVDLDKSSSTPGKMEGIGSTVAQPATNDSELPDRQE